MPWAAIAGAAVSAYSAKQKAQASAMPGMASDSRTAETVFDNSGWNVSFGNSKIDSTASKTVDQAGAAIPQSMGNTSPFGNLGAGGVDQKTLVYVALGVGFLLVLKKRRK